MKQKIDELVGLEKGDDPLLGVVENLLRKLDERDTIITQQRKKIYELTQELNDAKQQPTK